MGFFPEKNPKNVTEGVEDIKPSTRTHNHLVYKRTLNHLAKLSRNVHEKLIEFPWILVFDLGISTTRQGCHNFAEFAGLKACFLRVK